MNVNRVLLLAKLIENPKLLPVKFNMCDFHKPEVYGLVPREAPDCGTAYCVGGLACIAFGEPGQRVNEENAAKLLDLNDRQVHLLFYNWEDFISAKRRLRNITRKEAAAACRRLAASATPDNDLGYTDVT